MAKINELNVASTVAPGDLFVFWSQSNGDSLAISATNLNNWFKSQAGPANDGKVTQYAAPSATATTIAINDSSTSVFLIVSPAALYADGTIKLPSKTSAIDKQEVLVSYAGNGVTALTIDANGATAVVGSPAAMAAGGFFCLRYDAVYSSWYRVG